MLTFNASARKIITSINYYYSIPYVKKIKNLGYRIMDIEETIDYISVPGHSMIRFGDGEIDLINGIGIKGYQEPSDRLSKELFKVAMKDDKDLLICFPDALTNLNDKKEETVKHWVVSFRKHYRLYKKLCRKDYYYGNSFVSRPYFVYKDHTNIDVLFDKLKKVFANKNILIIEGEYSRSGVGNDLFLDANSINRIICPSKNAFDKYDKILEVSKKYANGKLVLVALGPTAKPLCAELHKNGIWVLDIGHIDSEYEWYLRRSESRVLIDNKHTAERSDSNIGACMDMEYCSSVVATIS